MKFAMIASIVALQSFALAPGAHAISEKNYQADYAAVVYPFLKSGETFTFKSADGKYDLSGVRFVTPAEKGLIVVVNGQSEPWLKYGEVFFDLYSKGYTVYSFDHRGQGLSPHLGKGNSQIGHVEHFVNYALDMNEFMEKVIKPVHPSSENLFVIAHSMGGAITSEYLELFSNPFEKVVLSAPMMRINTKPYPEAVARAIVAAASGLGLSRKYALGKKDYHCNGSFESNIVTGSRERWAMNNFICQTYPETTIGGPSSGWVNQSMGGARRVRKNADKIDAKVLLLQAGLDQLVIASGQNEACAAMKDCRISRFPNSQHEILMERDEIRDSAFQQIEAFFQN